jgi:hypothetical protein
MNGRSKYAELVFLGGRRDALPRLVAYKRSVDHQLRGRVTVYANMGENTNALRYRRICDLIMIMMLFLYRVPATVTCVENDIKNAGRPIHAYEEDSLTVYS